MMEINATDMTTESLAFESIESCADILDSVTGGLQHTIVYDEKAVEQIKQEVETDVVFTEDTYVEADPAVTAVETFEPLQMSPIIMNMANPKSQVHKLVNLNNLKLLPKTKFVNISNNKMKLVTLTGGKLVVLGNAINNKIDKVVTLNKLVSSNVAPKVVTVSPNSSPITIYNNEVVLEKEIENDIQSGDMDGYHPINTAPTDFCDSSSKSQEEMENDSIKFNQINGYPVTTDDTQSEGFFSKSEVILPDVKENYIKEEMENDSIKSNQINGYPVTTDDTQSEGFFSKSEVILPDVKENYIKMDNSGRVILCDMCPKVFSRKDHFTRHMKHVHHQKEDPLATFSCTECDKKYNFKSSLDRHVKDVHLGTSDNGFFFTCEKCEFKTKFKKSLKRHIHKLHDSTRQIEEAGQYFQCLECTARYKHQRNLRTHEIKFHDRRKKLRTPKKDKSPKAPPQYEGFENLEVEVVGSVYEDQVMIDIDYINSDQDKYEDEKEKLKVELEELFQYITENVETMEGISYVRSQMKPIRPTLDSLKQNEKSIFQLNTLYV